MKILRQKSGFLKPNKKAKYPVRYFDQNTDFNSPTKIFVALRVFQLNYTIRRHETMTNLPNFPFRSFLPRRFAADEQTPEVFGCAGYFSCRTKRARYCAKLVQKIGFLKTFYKTVSINFHKKSQTVSYRYHFSTPKCACQYPNSNFCGFCLKSVVYSVSRTYVFQKRKWATKPTVFLQNAENDVYSNSRCPTLSFVTPRYAF